MLSKLSSRAKSSTQPNTTAKPAKLPSGTSRTTSSRPSQQAQTKSNDTLKPGFLSRLAPSHKVPTPATGDNPAETPVSGSSQSDSDAVDDLLAKRTKAESTVSELNEQLEKKHAQLSETLESLKSKHAEEVGLLEEAKVSSSNVSQEIESQAAALKDLNQRLKEKLGEDRYAGWMKSRGDFSKAKPAPPTALAGVKGKELMEFIEVQRPDSQALGNGTVKAVQAMRLRVGVSGSSKMRGGSGQFDKLPHPSTIGNGSM
ncbi:hypothetical protein B0H10DRAFT_1977017 [Mycena sp. CBHHK59/15]|nr:hypothetical protein B0H10DRAFT_1977017 [Mycena sp. CBHHK59/15]